LNDRFLKTVGIIGLVAPVLILVCILLSVVSWNQFSWVNNALSDLGVQPGITSVLFNGTIVLGGLFFIIFSLGVFRLVEKQFVGKFGSGLLVVAFVAFTAIGIFNSSFSPTHYIVAVSFFVTFPLALLFLVRSFWLLGKRKLGLFTFVSTLVATLPWVLQFTFHYVQGIAIPEFISGIVMAIWVMTLSHSMQKNTSNKLENYES
jgi:hypothetical membrane protein